MLVAYTLRKTMAEMADMSLEEVNDWLAFFNVYNEREAKELEKASRRGRRR